jgi:predicted ATPase
MCHHYQAGIFIDNIPALGAQQRDAARRLVTFLDVAYEAGVRLVASAEVALDNVFAGLLRHAKAHGANVSLGRAKRLSDDALRAPPSSVTPLGQGVHDAELALAAAARLGLAGETRGPGNQNNDDNDDDSPAATLLLAEQVLMYHRATSRLKETCRGG